jgi:hypothetical protein
MEDCGFDTNQEIDILQEIIDSHFILTYNKFLTLYHQELLIGFDNFKKTIRLTKHGKMFDHLTFNDYARHIYRFTDKKIANHKY